MRMNSSPLDTSSSTSSSPTTSPPSKNGLPPPIGGLLTTTDASVPPPPPPPTSEYLLSTSNRSTSSSSSVTSSQQQQHSPYTNDVTLLNSNHNSHHTSTVATPSPTNSQISPRRSRMSTSSPSSKLMMINSTTAEDEVLDQITKDAEARLAARRAARAEAREIRLKEMSRQQKEMEETSDRHYDIMNSTGATITTGGAVGTGSSGPLSVGSSGYDSSHYQYNNSAASGLARLASLNNTARTTPTLLTRESRTGSFASSRRSSQESLDFAGVNSNAADAAREWRHQVNQLEEKFRQAMINNAQLDNEKQSFVYQIDLYKDDLEEMEENYIRINRDHKDKSKNYDQLKRDYDRTKADYEAYKAALDERDRLIIEGGLVLIRNESDQKIRLCSQKVLTNGSSMLNGDGKLMNGNMEDVNGEDLEEEDDDLDDDHHSLQLMNNISLISRQAAHLLADIPGTTLEAKLAAILGQNASLQATVKEVTSELEEERLRFGQLNDSMHNNSMHMTTEMEAEIQREANKQTNDLRYKLKKAEQEIQTLSATNVRLETQVARYKTIAEESERDADEQKTDKRKAQRELRDAQTRIEELESANNHLQKRIDKLKSNRVLIPTTNSAGNSMPTTPTPQPGMMMGSTAPFPPVQANGNGVGTAPSTTSSSSYTSSTTTSVTDTSTECSSECSSTIAD